MANNRQLKVFRTSVGFEDDRLKTMLGERAATERELASKIASLKEDLAVLKKRNADELAKLQRDVERQQKHYRQALASWREALPE